MGGALIREGAFIRINIVYAPVLFNHAPYGARESRDIAGLKCHGTAGGLFICVFMAREDYFTHFERSQSQGWAKTGDPQKKKKKPDYRKQSMACLTCNPRHNVKRFRVLKISGLNRAGLLIP